DPVGLAIGVRIEPVERLVELVRVVEAYAAQDAQPTGPGHRSGHVLGRGEGEDRVLEPEPLAEIGVHQADTPVETEANAISLARGYCALPAALRGISSTTARTRGSL